MKTYVLDASVAAKWFLRVREPLAEEAVGLLRRHVKAEVDFLVPDLFFAEFANIFWKAQRLGRCDKELADAAIHEIVNKGLPTYPSAPLVQPALQIARAFERTVYDSLYVALAVQTDSHFITADEKLANSSAGQLPIVWLAYA